MTPTDILERLRVQIKPLEWPARTRNGDIYADSVVGQYGIGMIGGTFSVLLRVIRDGQDHDLTVARDLASETEAKAAAQDDFATRICSALISSTKGAPDGD